jgi:hypothetical protein
MARNRMVIEMGTSRRPLGVSVIAVIAIVLGIVTAVLGLLGVLTGFVSGIMDSPRGAGREFLAGVVGLVLGAAYVLAGVGLWNLRPWAWWLAVLVGIVGFALAFGSPVWMVIWAVLVVYLFLVRGTFGVLPGAPRLITPA